MGYVARAAMTTSVSVARRRRICEGGSVIREGVLFERETRRAVRPAGEMLSHGDVCDAAQHAAVLRVPNHPKRVPNDLMANGDFRGTLEIISFWATNENRSTRTYCGPAVRNSGPEYHVTLCHIPLTLNHPLCRPCF